MTDSTLQNENQSNEDDAEHTSNVQPMQKAQESFREVEEAIKEVMRVYGLETRKLADAIERSQKRIALEAIKATTTRKVSGEKEFIAPFKEVNERFRQIQTGQQIIKNEIATFGLRTWAETVSDLAKEFTRVVAGVALYSSNQHAFDVLAETRKKLKTDMAKIQHDVEKVS